MAESTASMPNGLFPYLSASWAESTASMPMVSFPACPNSCLINIRISRILRCSGDIVHQIALCHTQWLHVSSTWGDGVCRGARGKMCVFCSLNCWVGWSGPTLLTSATGNTFVSGTDMWGWLTLFPGRHEHVSPYPRKGTSNSRSGFVSQFVY